MIRRLFLENGKIGLSRLIPQDAAWLETWVNDPETTRFMATGRTQATPQALAAQIEAWKEPNDYPFAIVLDGYQDPIGTVGLYSLDWISSKAEFRILIGDPYCGKGWGTIATRLTLDFAFQRLRLNRVWLGVTAGNVRAIIAYQTAGFRTEARLTEDLFRDGRYHDSIRMAVIRARWLQDHPEHDLRVCLCGCGQQLVEPPMRYVRGHRLKDYGTAREFWARVPKGEGCWEWNGTRVSGGYGSVSNGRKCVGAHRFAYELVYGPIPAGLLVRHTCDNPPCVRPDHLILGTTLDNKRDSIARGRAKMPPRRGRWDTEKAKQAETSAPGPDTASRAVGPLTDSSRPAEA